MVVRSKNKSSPAGQNELGLSGMIVSTIPPCSSYPAVATEDPSPMQEPLIGVGEPPLRRSLPSHSSNIESRMPSTYGALTV